MSEFEWKKNEKDSTNEWLGYKSTKGKTGRKQMLANAM
jgi:hypothetical protein